MNAESKTWTFFTNHSHVLFYIAKHPDMPMRDVALKVGITERAVQRIVHDLTEEEILQVDRIGRRNHYRVQPQFKLRHTLESHRTIGELLEFIQAPAHSKEQ